MSSHFGVLFVCLGNICRSPLAEGIFRKWIAEDEHLRNQVIVDSCGTGDWHVGKPPHHESQHVARSFGIDISSQRARRLSIKDRDDFSLLIAMDRENQRDIKSVLGTDVVVHCLREFDSERQDLQGSLPDVIDLDVPDPYFGGTDGFLEVYQIIERSMEDLIEHIRREISLHVS